MAVSVRESRALNTRRPFSRADARRAGIRLSELLSPRFHKIFYDCYVASTMSITTELRAEAALGISPPGSYVSHFTAAQLWGAVVPDVSDVHVTVPGRPAAPYDGESRLMSPPMVRPRRASERFRSRLQCRPTLIWQQPALICVAARCARGQPDQGVPDERPRTPRRCSRVARSRSEAGAQSSALCTRRRGLGHGEPVEDALGVGRTPRAASELHHAPSRWLVADALRPLLSGTQTDHRV